MAAAAPIAARRLRRFIQDDAEPYKSLYRDEVVQLRNSHPARTLPTPCPYRAAALQARAERSLAGATRPPATPVNPHLHRH